MSRIQASLEIFFSGGTMVLQARESPLLSSLSLAGRVSKWLKDADCKSARFVRSSVRIRPLPPFFDRNGNQPLKNPPSFSEQPVVGLPQDRGFSRDGAERSGESEQRNSESCCSPTKNLRKSSHEKGPSLDNHNHRRSHPLLFQSMFGTAPNMKDARRQMRGSRS